MAQDINERVPHKRRRKQKTDYKQRKKLLKSGKPRAVVRTSNKHTKAHLSHYETEGDKNTSQTTSKELEKYDWDEHTGNLPAAYLTGYLMAMKTEQEEAILDIGLREKKNGGRVFAAVKGMNDAGLNVPVGEKALPKQERIQGKHIQEMTDKDIPTKVEKVKEKIQGEHN